jgi:hypothetical protein
VPLVPGVKSLERTLSIRALPAKPASPIVSGPTVEITIGRIDVRAIPAPRVEATPPRETAPSPTTVSLEDYLARGARRRP